MTTTPNMNLVLPTDKGSSNVWDSILDTVFGLIDSHGHVTGQGVPIVSAALNINADLSFQTNSPTHLKASVFDQVATSAVASYVNATFVNSADANLYFRNAGGVNVQITAGNALNVAGFVGGIGGDYSSVNALLQYNDASRTYWLQQEGSPRPWAKLGTGDISLYQAAASIANSVNLKSPNALAASYTLTFPGALAAGQALQTVDNSGNIAWVGNVAGNPAPAIYATDFKQTAALTLQVPNAMADLNSNGRVASSGHGRQSLQLSGGTGAAGQSAFPIPLKVGDQITGWTLYLNKSTDNTNTITAQMIGYNGSTFTLQSAQTNSANNPGAITLSQTGLAVSIVAAQSWWVTVGMTAGAGTADLVFHLEVTYLRP